MINDKAQFNFYGVQWRKTCSVSVLQIIPELSVLRKTANTGIKISDTEITQTHTILSHIHANNTPRYTYHLRSVFWAAIDVFNLFICWKAQTKNKAKNVPKDMIPIIYRACAAS